MVKKLPPKLFKAIYSKVPRLCVDLVIETEKGVLLTLRDIEPFKGDWHFPGSTVLKGEALEDTVRRIGKEELGVKIIPEKFLGIIDWGQHKYYPGGVFSIVYLAKIIKGEIKTDRQAKEAKFFKTLPQNIIPEHKQFLKNIEVSLLGMLS